MIRNIAQDVVTLIVVATLTWAIVVWGAVIFTIVN